MFGSRQKAREKLASAVHEALGAPDWLESVTVNEDGRAILVIRAEPGDAAGAEARRIEAENAAGRIAGIQTVTSVLTAEKRQAAAIPMPRRVIRRTRRVKVCHFLPLPGRAVSRRARASPMRPSPRAPPARPPA